MIRLGDVVIIGGGCYGTFYAGQLQKARAKGSVLWDRLILVDHDRDCAVSALVSAIPDAALVVAEWGAFLDGWLLEEERGAEDQIVPSPLMPHLMAEWLARRGAREWPTARIERVPAEASFGTPFDRLHPTDAVRYVSFADWLCPTHCIEPAICPAIKAPRTWEMSDEVIRWTEARRRERPTAGPALFPCRHVVHGVGMYPAEMAFLGFAAWRAQMAATPSGADLVVGSVSSCHGAIGILRAEFTASREGTPAAR